jgi:hypothetical protein
MHLLVCLELVTGHLQGEIVVLLVVVVVASGITQLPTVLLVHFLLLPTRDLPKEMEE